MNKVKLIKKTLKLNNRFFLVTQHKNKIMLELL